MAQISLNSLMNNNAPTYSPAAVQPFRDELTVAGFTELLTPAGVDAALDRDDDKLTLVVLNSVCGCAAGKARPGVLVSMLNDTVPDQYVTVFAGMEKEAVNHFREKYLAGITPSSPNIALFSNGKLVHLLQRYQVEGKTAGDIAQELITVYNRACTKKNTPEEQEKLKIHIENKYQVKIGSLNA
ncbi:MAG: BrxA/BrxB family bacilliredoxin [Bacteroidota bacterium]|nr:BrxA/BrxB family bacilliredoxin [Bacteroidota bacterium]